MGATCQDLEIPKDKLFYSWVLTNRWTQKQYLRMFMVWKGALYE